MKTARRKIKNAYAHFVAPAPFCAYVNNILLYKYILYDMVQRRTNVLSDVYWNWRGIMNFYYWKDEQKKTKKRITVV